MGIEFRGCNKPSMFGTNYVSLYIPDCIQSGGCLLYNRDIPKATESIKCVTSGIHSNSRNQTRMYANCCIIEHHGGNSYGMSENSPNLKVYNNASDILTLSDFDEQCNKN